MCALARNDSNFFDTLPSSQTGVGISIVIVTNDGDCRARKADWRAMTGNSMLRNKKHTALAFVSARAVFYLTGSEVFSRLCLRYWEGDMPMCF